MILHGKETLAGRRQLIVKHFIFGPKMRAAVSVARFQRTPRVVREIP